nr:CopD family protein [Limimaricola litoreus]
MAGLGRAGRRVSWLYALVPHLKALHLGMLVLWSGGLFALPLMLARHDPAIGQGDYERIRRATHYAYTFCITPAAVITIASGTALVFLREVFVTWMFAKLVFVALLVSFHVWVGYVLVAVAERAGAHRAPRPLLPLLLLLLPILGILALVLAKPELGEIPMPAWLTEPLGRQLPFDVPRR